MPSFDFFAPLVLVSLFVLCVRERPLRRLLPSGLSALLVLCSMSALRDFIQSEGLDTSILAVLGGALCCGALYALYALLANWIDGALVGLCSWIILEITGFFQLGVPPDPDAYADNGMLLLPPAVLVVHSVLRSVSIRRNLQKRTEQS